MDLAKQQAAPSAAELLTPRWANATAVHAKVADAYATLRLDPVATIDHLTLWDVTAPRTASFVTAYTTICDLRALHGDTRSGDRADVLEYESAVRAASVAFDDAVAYAKASGATSLSSTDQRIVRKASGLLRRAQDPAAPAPEPALAALRAKDLLDQLTVLWPAETEAAIETIARRELETATA